MDRGRQAGWYKWLKRWKGRHIKLRRKLLASLDLPVETEPSVPKLTMLGNHELLVENHAGVLRYETYIIRLKTYTGGIVITGEGLELLELSGSRAYVRGVIAGIVME